MLSSDEILIDFFLSFLLCFLSRCHYQQVVHLRYKIVRYRTNQVIRCKWNVSKALTVAYHKDFYWN